MSARTRLFSAVLLAATLGVGAAAHAQPRQALPTYYDPQAVYDPCACGPGPYYGQQPQSGQSAWRPGLLLPPNMRGYKMDGWYRFLGKPARGYAWYKIGNEFVLASTASGEIVKIVTYPN